MHPLLLAAREAYGGFFNRSCTSSHSAAPLRLRSTISSSWLRFFDAVHARAVSVLS